MGFYIEFDSSEGGTVRRLLAQMRDMLECRRVKPLLQPFLDGELGEEEAVLVSRHVDACRRCGLAAETFREKAGLARLAEDSDRETVQRLELFVTELDDEG
ncbi:MAG TPA: zf-HC2 domain-containing protein [Egibacteraceae bacterium]|nr:zf-HC2 domain-containing protein [Egibacteraceae bacterium]